MPLENAMLHWLLKRSALALALRILGMGATLAFTVVIARWFGPAGTGLYSLSLSLMNIAVILARAGTSRALLRYLSAYAHTLEWAVVKGLYDHGLKRTLVAAAGLSLGLTAITPLLGEYLFAKPTLPSVLYWMALSVFPTALIFLHVIALRAVSQLVLSLVLDKIAVPLMALSILWGIGTYYGVAGAAFGYFTASATIALTAYMAWRISVPQLRHVVADDSALEAFQASSAHLFWVEVLTRVAPLLPVLLLGVWTSAEATGIYTVAWRITALSAVAVEALNLVVGPRFSALYQAGKFPALLDLHRQVTMLSAMLALMMMIFLPLGGRWILGVFGTHFVAGYPFLLILAVGYAFNMVCGPMNSFLAMTGHEDLLKKTSMWFIGLMIGGALFLIPAYGAWGAAIIASLVMIVRYFITLYFVYFVKKNLQIR